VFERSWAEVRRGRWKRTRERRKGRRRLRRARERWGLYREEPAKWLRRRRRTARGCRSSSS
jgi:hypothetical protein